MFIIRKSLFWRIRNWKVLINTKKMFDGYRRESSLTWLLSLNPTCQYYPVYPQMTWIHQDEKRIGFWIPNILLPVNIILSVHKWHGSIKTREGQVSKSQIISQNIQHSCHLQQDTKIRKIKNKKIAINPGFS